MNQHYEIVIQGHLTQKWAVIFDGMDISVRPDGNTMISGLLPDQAALYGLLLRLRDLGLTLISLNPSR